jgi:hypothetical protein
VGGLFVTDERAERKARGAEDVFGGGVVGRGVFEDDEFAARVGERGSEAPEDGGFVAFDVELEEVRGREGTGGDEGVAGGRGDQHRAGVGGLRPRGEGGHAGISGRTEVEREEAVGVGKGERGGDEVGGVPRPVAEEAGVLAGVGFEGDDGGGGHETGKGRGMEAEIGADIPEHGAGTEAGAEGVEDFGFIEALANDETVDVGEGVELKDGAGGSVEPDLVAVKAAWEEAA